MIPLATGNLFSATFTAVAVTQAQDVFEITAPTTRRVRIHDIRLGQYSDAGDAAAELLSVLVIRGYTVSGSAGSSVTPANLISDSTRTAQSTVEANNTTVANTGTGVTLISDAWNVQAGAWIAPISDRAAIIIGAGVRLVVRITVPADSLTMNGTMIFEELYLPD